MCEKYLNVIFMDDMRYRWVVLFASFYTFVAYAFVLQLVPPLIMSIEGEFGISDTEAGLLMSMVVIPGIFLALPLGIMIDKFGARRIGVMSTILAASGSLLTAVSNSFAMALLGRFILGVGGAFIVVATASIIPQWFAPEDLGKAMGIYGTNMPIATILAFPTASALMLMFSNWRHPFYVGATLAAASAVIFPLVAKEGPLRDSKTQKNKPKLHQALTNVEVWKVGAVWLLFNLAAISFLTWAPKLFEEFRYLPPFHASLLASVFMYSALPLVPFFGWVSDRTGRRKPLMISGSLLMTLALIAAGFTSDIGLLLSVVVLGIAAAMVPPIVMTLPSEILGSGSLGLGFGITTVCLNIGVTLAGPLGGHLIVATRSMAATFTGMAMFSILGSIVAYMLKTV